ncbi:MAG: HAMP domain-containing protein, partial [Proteobacteria bacterium]|nr:HAMP domain-containing protein [Pseudomonadota bacterium]
MKFKSLRQRLIVLLILPVGTLMLGMGLLGFVYARQVMLDRWRESALLSLERAAHSVDMRIDDLVKLVRLLGAISQTPQLPFVERWLLDRLRTLPGVTRAALKLTAATPAPGIIMRRGGPMMAPGRRGPMGMAFHRVRVSQVTSPRYDTKTGHQVVALVFDLKDAQGKTIGRLTVELRFKYLLQDIVGLRWWQSHDVCLVDHSGRILASRGRLWHGRRRLGGADRPLETALLGAMTKRASGTLLGAGHPPDLVAGHYRLKRAPWSLILFAPGAKVLAPIVRFRSYFFLAALASVALIILVIRLVTGPMVKSVTEVSEAAGQVARGDYTRPLRTKSADEIGRLVESFNTMVEGLQERDFIRDTFGRYVDPQVARELVNVPGATRLGGQKRRVVIMMTDIRGFTPLCEALSPEE